MHPIEHLRHVARSRAVDESELVREAAIALGSMRASGPDLVVACRRIVERHAEIGALWWLCARLLTSAEPSRLAWQIADEVASDPTPRAIAAALPDDATVVTIGWPAVAGAALLRRGDARVLCADSRHEASAFLRQLERADIECDPVPVESLARAVAAADLVLIEGVAACPRRVLAPVGSHVLAAVAAHLDTPVWCALGIGRRLPGEYVDAIADRAVAGYESFDVDIDELPIRLLSHVATTNGVCADVATALQPECVFVPELMRSSPM
ncbi:MAG TPA: hypothetical protein VF065_03150 [Ilumatobacter sp.]